MINGSEFNKLYAKENGVSQREAAFTCESVFRLLRKLLYKDRKSVRAPRLGVFRLCRAPQKRVRHPSSGEMTVTPEREIIRFRQSETSLDFD
ncbi:MAG: HU family DNA-binding protein [Firmicutes bacterium]|nr:HU family DNA-binding protein [Bacillota bacterium]